VLIDIFETAFLKTVVMKLIYFQIMVWTKRCFLQLQSTNI